MRVFSTIILTATALVASPVSPVSSASAQDRPCGMLVGYLPYWADRDTTDISRLTHVACFSVDVRANGEINNQRNWPWPTAINRIRANDAKVLLTLTNFSPPSLDALLSSPAARARAIIELRPLLVGHADGISIDFEGSASNGWPTRLPAFLNELRAAYENDIPGFEIHVATPAVNWNNGWPLTAVADASDALFIMGYDFFGSWSTIAGPTAPLTGTSINITDTVMNQYQSVRLQSPEKFVLGLPLYGNRWTTAAGTTGAAALAHLGSVTFASFYNQTAGIPPIFDAASQTTFRPTQTIGGWQQTWCDNTDTLGLKIDLALDTGLGGIGFWALGYEGSPASASAQAVWSMVDSRYIARCSPLCPADVFYSGSGPAALDVNDVIVFVGSFGAQMPEGDINRDGVWNVNDVIEFVQAFATGCD